MSCGSHWYRYLIVFKESRKSWILSAPQAYLLPCILKKTRKMKTHLQFYYKLSQASISPQWSTLESLESVPSPPRPECTWKEKRRELGDQMAGSPQGPRLGRSWPVAQEERKWRCTFLWNFSLHPLLFHHWTSFHPQNTPVSFLSLNLAFAHHELLQKSLFPDLQVIIQMSLPLKALPQPS